MLSMVISEGEEREEEKEDMIAAYPYPQLTVGQIDAAAELRK